MERILEEISLDLDRVSKIGFIVVSITIVQCCGAGAGGDEII